MSQTLHRLEETTDVRAMESDYGDLSPSVPEPEAPAGPSTGDVKTIQPANAQLQSPVVEVAVPVHNEEQILETSIVRLRKYLDDSFPFQATIRIVDNASTDATGLIATRMAETLDGVSVLRLEEKGKGRAIRAAWSTSTAQIVAYMDVDLSTDLGGLLPLVAPLLSGHSDVSIGTRFAQGARVLRGARRELVSRGYNLILRAVLRNQFSDATCGFKAARRESAQLLLPLVKDEEWFFDTELLISAERSGFRIHEVPVDWIDDADSRVNIRNVAHDDLRGIARLMRNRATGQEPIARAENPGHHLHSTEGTRYAGVGILSTLAYLLSFFLLRASLGTYGANVVALALSTVGNTIAHLRFTFGPKSGMGTRQATFAGALAFATGVALTTLALGIEALLGTTSASAEVVAILVGIVSAAFVRLTLFRASAYRVHTQNKKSSTAT
jgi:glycosyltransferase involved in cell wall biosynthesis